MLKKVILTVLCALIITCMAVAVSAAETTVADLNFDDASQVTLFRHYHTATFDPTGGMDGTGALKIEFQTNQRIFDTSSYTWEKGYIYTVSFDAKATKEFAIHFMASFSENHCIDSNGTARPYPGYYRGVKTDWKHYSFNVEVYDLANGGDSHNGTIMVNGHEFVAGEALYIDNYKITKKPIASTVTVTNGVGGTIARKVGEDYTDLGAAAALNIKNGETVTFKVTPEAGKIAEVSINGAPVELSATGEFGFVVNDDAVIEITYTSVPTDPEIAANSTTTLFNMVGETPTVYIYSKLNGFVPGTEAQNYGIKIWKTEDPENALELHACDYDGTLATVTPNAAFAIKVYGAAIKTDTSYTVVPFIGTTLANAEQKTITFNN